MSISRRALLVAGGSTAALLGAGIRPGAAAANDPQAAGAGVVTQWNRILLTIVRVPAIRPPTTHPTRSFAMLHKAMHAAVAAVLGKGDPDLLDIAVVAGGSPVAAAAQAAHDVLAALYPGAATDLDRQLHASLAAVRDAPARTAGTRVGARAAGLVVAERADDGSAAAPSTFEPGMLAGQFRPTPPGFEAAAFTRWGEVTPFVLDRADQFCPPPFPALTSARHHEAVNEVKYLGRTTNSGRTADQTDQAHFWAAPIHHYWYELAHSAVAADHVDVLAAARVFDDLSLAFADATIAGYEAKYHHLVWRPVTAIRHDAETQQDMDWTPLLATPATPSYPAGHSVIAQAGATVLAHHFGARDAITITSEATNTTRSYASFQAVADEAGLSRVAAGVHTRLDHESGQPLGRAVAQFVLDRRTGPA
jgi:hypothetical protein